MENKSESKKCFEDGHFAVQGLMAGMEAETNPQIVNAVRKITEGANKMKKKVYNDDVERIVNDPERQEAINAFHEKRQAQRQRKMLMDGIIFACVCFPIGVFYWTGLMSVWVTAPLQIVCSLYSAFRFGRWFENGKCWGWK